jgi:transposase-like protein
MKSQQIADLILSLTGQKWTSPRVRSRAQRLGIVTPRPLVDDPDANTKREIVRRMWATHSVAAIAHEVGVSSETVSRWGKMMRLSARAVPHGNKVKSSPSRAELVAGESGPLIASVALEAQRKRWQLEIHLEGRRDTHIQLRCVCGRPGAPHCAEHRALLHREGVL